jgi:hypothetical protein
LRNRPCAASARIECACACVSRAPPRLAGKSTPASNEARHGRIRLAGGLSNMSRCKRDPEAEL